MWKDSSGEGDEMTVNPFETARTTKGEKNGKKSSRKN